MPTLLSDTSDRPTFVDRAGREWIFYAPIPGAQTQTGWEWAAPCGLRLRWIAVAHPERLYHTLVVADPRRPIDSARQALVHYQRYLPVTADLDPRCVHTAAVMLARTAAIHEWAVREAAYRRQFIDQKLRAWAGVPPTRPSAYGPYA